MSLRPRLLWVDDDPKDNYVYELGVLDSAGWDLTWVDTLSGAAEELSQHAFQAVLLDQNVTDKEGVRTEQVVWGACRILYWLRRVNDKTRPWLQVGEAEPWGHIEPLAANVSIPALLISGFHKPEVLRVTYQADPADLRIKLLSKPIDEHALLNWLRTHARATR